MGKYRLDGDYSAADQLSDSTGRTTFVQNVKLVDAAGNATGSSVTSAPAGTGASSEPLWSANDIIGLRINTAASGVTALVAAVTSQSTRVYGLRLSVAGAVIVQIRDGATILEVFNFAANGGSVVLNLRGRPYYIGTANTALNINLSAAVQVDGRLEYVTS